MTGYNEMMCTSAASKVNGKFPFKWDLNIYRGCKHGCKYCYAVYSHGYLGNKNGYFDDIYVKVNIVEKLEEQLRKPSWKGEVINIGGVTDSYQPVEAQYELMPEILKLMIKYKNPCIISTKSSLILRDYDLIDELSRIAMVNVAATITCADEKLRQKIEPYGAKSEKRFAMIKEFSKTKASVGVHFMPIIPFVTDSKDNILTIYENAVANNADYVLPGLLYLRGMTRDVFLDFMNLEFPEKVQPLMEFYNNKKFKQEYRVEIYKLIGTAAKTYGISSNYMKFMTSKSRTTEAVQLSLFD